MKIALCLSGQPRSLETAYEYVHRNLLSQYDVDVFCHFWYKPELDESFARYYRFIQDFYKPAAVMFEQEWGPEVGYQYPRIANSFYPAHFTLSFYHSLFKANTLKQLTEKETGVNYDWVVRSRYDLALNFIIPFETLDETKLYVPNDRMTPEHDFCNDQFAYGSSEVMDAYSSTHLYIDDFYNSGCTINGEDLLQANLRKQGLTGPRMEYVDINNPFPPGKYNGNWHSLVRDDIETWKAQQLFSVQNQHLL